METYISFFTFASSLVLISVKFLEVALNENIILLKYDAVNKNAYVVANDGNKRYCCVW